MSKTNPSLRKYMLMLSGILLLTLGSALPAAAFEQGFPVQSAAAWQPVEAAPPDASTLRRIRLRQLKTLDFLLPLSLLALLAALPGCLPNAGRSDDLKSRLKSVPPLAFGTDAKYSYNDSDSKPKKRKMIVCRSKN